MNLLRRLNFPSLLDHPDGHIAIPANQISAYIVHALPQEHLPKNREGPYFWLPFVKNIVSDFSQEI